MLWESPSRSSAYIRGSIALAVRPRREEHSAYSASLRGPLQRPAAALPVVRSPPDAAAHAPDAPRDLRAVGPRIGIVERVHHVRRLRARLVRAVDDLGLGRHRLHGGAVLELPVVREDEVLQLQQLSRAA